MIFKDLVYVFTYNPQGGFTPQSLKYRTRWEKAFATYLARVKEEATRNNRKVIWAGDLTVNPTEADWTPKAFEMIAHKIPKGTLPTGCREEDQKAYRELVQTIDGVNMADCYSSEKKGDMFPGIWNEDMVNELTILLCRRN